MYIGTNMVLHGNMDSSLVSIQKQKALFLVCYVTDWQSTLLMGMTFYNSIIAAQFLYICLLRLKKQMRM